MHMKKFITAFTTILTAILTIFFTTEIPNANAASIQSEVWTEARTDNMVKFYDLNNSGKVDILDLVTAKNNILNEGTISIYDLINLRHYLNTGELLFDLRYEEWDCDEATWEHDAAIKEATTGLLKEWKYEDNCLRTRFLKNTAIIELRFFNFERPMYYSGVPEKNPKVIASLNNFYNIWKNNADNRYFVDELFVINNAVPYGCGSTEDFNNEDILFIKDDYSEGFSNMYITRGNYIEVMTLPHISQPETFERIVYTTNDSRMAFLCRKEANGSLGILYGKSVTYWNLNNLVPNADNLEDFDPDGKFMRNINAELLFYKTTGSDKVLFLQHTDGSILILNMDPTRIEDAKYIIKEWEKDGQKYVLGASSNNKFVWDSSSTFTVG